MTDGSSTPPGWRALDWPEEWARERSFWREVAARTFAGAFALILLGGPSIIYLMLAGQLEPSAGFSILIGIGMVGLVALIWWLTRRIVRSAAQRSLRRIVRAERKAAAPGASVNLEAINRAVNEFLQQRRERGDPFGDDFEATLVPRSRLQRDSGSDLKRDSDSELKQDTQKRMRAVLSRARWWSILSSVSASVAALALSFWVTTLLGR
ncbi:MAG: hypothetical protein K0R99_435 [Microbacterium sp.]|jgi:hypothetical protein|uniref:hypothetical protein n=1 Tax=Microbacterium sp. TaxID=51671 RepID=UPI00260E5A09|nr:hypothetical protein [Microbacterium sp.]MDF2558989.1 hypothetical protein [Microbacterium sp.]